MKYQQALKIAEQKLVEQNIEDASLDAWLLMEHITGMSRARYYVDCFSEMSKEHEEMYFAYIEKRMQRIPLQHITGVQEFMGLEFCVNEHVLVPRQDTEILVESVDKLVRNEEACVLDMCTGSGCIAISLKVRNPQIKCTAVDISDEALKVAVKNAKRHQSDIKFIKSDMFEAVDGEYDIIVSNPPYIPTHVIEELEEEVRLHDPFGALDGKEDGLYFYRILASESKKHLNDNGKLYMEIGPDQSEDVENLLKEAGFEEICTQKDLAGLDRVVSGVYNKHS